MKIKPDLVQVRFNLAMALANRGRLDEAVSQFRKALEIQPDLAEARHFLDVALSKREELVKSLAERRELLRSRPTTSPC